MNDAAGSLLDMPEAIDKITLRLAGGREEFDVNELA